MDSATRKAISRNWKGRSHKKGGQLIKALKEKIVSKQDEDELYDDDTLTPTETTTTNNKRRKRA